MGGISCFACFKVCCRPTTLQASGHRMQKPALGTFNKGIYSTPHGWKIMNIKSWSSCDPLTSKKKHLRISQLFIHFFRQGHLQWINLADNLKVSVLIWGQSYEQLNYLAWPVWRGSSEKLPEAGRRMGKKHIFWKWEQYLEQTYFNSYTIQPF